MRELSTKLSYQIRKNFFQNLAYSLWCIKLLTFPLEEAFFIKYLNYTSQNSISASDRKAIKWRQHTCYSSVKYLAFSLRKTRKEKSNIKSSLVAWPLLKKIHVSTEHSCAPGSSEDQRAALPVNGGTWFQDKRSLDISVSTSSLLLYQRTQISSYKNN